MKKEWIFECRKCGHRLFVDKKNMKKILTTDCPECGEEASRNWLIDGEGVFGEE